MNKTNRILIPVSPAELMDKISILELKEKRFTDKEQIKNVKTELRLLRGIFSEKVKPSKKLTTLFNSLRKLNGQSWNVENEKRYYEHIGDTGPRFIKAASMAFKNNDKRASIWKEINLFLKSDIVQEKSYEKK